MEVVRVSEEWQKAAAYYVRARVCIEDFKVNLSGEFSGDAPHHDYVVVFDGILPVATCRIHYLDKDTGQIERVATLLEYRKRHCASAAVLEAERWLKEKGVTKILINSRKAVVGFYEKLGYIPDYTRCSGSGLFECVMTEKILD